MLLLLFNQPASGNPTVSLGATEGADTAAFTVRNRARVTLGATEAPDVAAFAASVVSVAPAVSLTATEGSDVAAFAVRGPALAPTGGGAGDYFTNVPNFARRWVDIREELEEKPTPEVVREAARSIVQAQPDIEPAALQSLIDEQLRAYDLLSSLLAIAQEEARLELQRLQMLEQDEEEVQQAIRLFVEYLQ
jgi:4-diphosphocytidyl-2C-methyl-D-erythritol kinase